MSSYKVAILLRTKNRPVFLRRALETLRAQSFQDFRIHIINDGGDMAALRACVAECGPSWGERLSCVDLPRSVGRSKALALALAVSDEPYILIHDDDDTLEPSFLAETVAFLERDGTGFYAGVTTSNYDVYERIEDGRIITDRKTDQFGRKSGSLVDYGLYLSHMYVIMPITFLFRRAALAVAGGVETRLDYVEDHDLFLRVMMAGEVGILEECLCSYHHRLATGDANDASQHEVTHDYELAYKNGIIRKAMQGGDRLRQMQAGFIQGNHLGRSQLGQLSRQVAQLQEGFASLSQVMVELLGHIRR
ncbi:MULTISPECIES: glycosyltransferase family 2 protein [Acetobacteraceae]|uniref:Glycosyl transferase, family 2 n=1 Tax=Parasaccharibacter apium TaxID=1510841 RepID=A0A7U7G4S5_9PROT|nr:MULTISPECIES: glycosyltransferase family 2 protein [Acetobacteraceae]MCT6819415.1 glycosyltransferase [Bombella apis]MCT6845692.1 glycosyltransferase [Bombella apis]MPV99712.1 glycosyltransferase [Bombella apis]CDG33045.1 glycosyl transferase, family 2 [Parasaccharibacter apium]